MVRFTIEISDPAQLHGIAEARQSHNDALPAVHDEKNEPITPRPGTIATDAEFVQHLILQIAKSYAAIYQTDVTELDARIVKLQRRKDALKQASNVEG